MRDSENHVTPFVLNEALVHGAPLHPDLGYVKRKSSETQAERWNEILADDPLHGPSTGFIVGVAPMAVGGVWPLVWVKR